MKKICLLVALIMLFTAGNVWASGFRVPEQGAAMLGVANAWVATADKPSAISINPAGITQLPGPSLEVGLVMIMPGFEYESPMGDTTDAVDNTFFLPNLYGTYKLDQWAFGLGVSVPFGLASEWEEDSFARYVSTLTELQLVNINPVVAYEFNEMFSVAVGADYYYSMITIDRMLPWGGITYGMTGDMSALAIPDGKFGLEGDGGGWGWNAGLLAKLNESWSIGFSYRSEVTVKYEDGDVDLGDIGGVGVPIFGGTEFSTKGSSEITFPAVMQFGVAGRVIPALLIEVDVEWTGWSSYDELALDFEDEVPPILEDTASPKDWEDTWTFRVGATYSLNETWDLRVGYLYDKSPIPDETYDTMLPDADKRHGITLGVGWSNAKWFVDAGYMALFGTEREITDSTMGHPFTDINGTYTSFTNLFSLSGGYYF